MPPLVSVVIPTYNYARFLPEAIQSVLEQTFTDHEIIVVDGGSIDNTREVVEQFGDRLRYIYRPSPSPNNSRNAGVLASRGRYVAFLDADDKWLPEKLQQQLPLIDANPQVGLVYAGMLKFESETGAIIGHHPIERCYRGRVLRKLYRWQFVPAPTPLIRREVFDHVGLFDENLLAADDWEMWLRIAAQYELDYVPRPLALYRVHASAAGRKSVELYERGMLAFFAHAAETYPELRPLRAWRLSTFAERLGWRLVGRGEALAGRARLRRAIAFSRRRIRPYWLLALSYLMGRMDTDDFHISRVAYFQGKHYLFNLRLAEARARFWRAICANPWSSSLPYAGLALTFGGKRMVRWVCQGRGLEHYADSPGPRGDHVSFQQW